MKLDLRHDIAPIAAEVARRVRELDASSNNGPGDRDRPIQQIIVGYSFEQSAWITLVFDTRSDADPVYDGEWQAFIDENRLDYDTGHWIDAFDALFERNEEVTITSVDGDVRRLDPHIESDDEGESEAALSKQLAELFGTVLRDALVLSRENGVFSRLQLTSNCVLRVDEHEGQYGWPDFKVRGTEKDEGRIGQK